ncbi:MAG: SLATT domain-containing protein [Pyrinomonadaceae bacterium]
MRLEAKDLLDDWLFRIRKAQLAHIKTAVYFERVNLWLGVPVVILTTLVGTSVFATLQKETATSIKIAVGIASVLAAIMAGLQTFLRYSERAERHRVSGGKYGTLRREVEQRLAFPLSNSDELNNYIDLLRQRWDKLSEDCPTAPDRIWDRAGSQIRAIKSGRSSEVNN